MTGHTPWSEIKHKRDDPADDVRIVRGTLLIDGYANRDALAALARLEARIAELERIAPIGQESEMERAQRKRAEAAEARVRELEAALEIIATTTYPAIYIGRRDDGTEMYGGSDDASRFARAALKQAEE